MGPWVHRSEYVSGAQPELERCPAETDMMRHTHVRCDKPRGHSGNHHASVTLSDVHLAGDGHSIKATA